MAEEFAIIVAGGTGSRMRNELPKQFLNIKEIPLLFYSIRAFYDYSGKAEIILVMNADYIELWNELCKKYNFNIPHRIVKGGKRRFHSVQNGLKAIHKTNGIVAIHDAARPLITKEFIKQCYEAARDKKAIIPYIDIHESLRKTDGNISKPINRDKVKIIQTPQCFSLELIKNAYKQNYNSKFTDDATVFERSGLAKISLIKGLKYNIKITEKSDLKLAEFLIKDMISTHLH